MARAGAIGALLGLGLVIAAPAAAEPEPQLALLEEGQNRSHMTFDVAVSPDGRHVYASGNSFVAALRREADGRLTVIEEYPLSGSGLRIVVPADGLGVLVVADASGVAAVASYLRNGSDGKLTWVENEAAQLGPYAHALAASRDGEHVYVTSPYQDDVLVYTRDAAAGTLAFAQKIHATDAGVSGLVDPLPITVSPDDRHVYVSGLRQDGDQYHDTVVVLERKPDDSLAFVESLDTDDVAVGLKKRLLVTPDGAEVLLLDSGVLVGDGAEVRRFARDAADGRLAFVTAQPIAAPGFFEGTVDWFALRPDGRRMFFAGLSSGSPGGAPVMAWSRDEAGVLAPLARVETGFLIDDGAVSPDGRYVYTSQARYVRVLVPEPEGAAPAALAVLAALGLSRRARRRRPRARASARA